MKKYISILLSLLMTVTLFSKEKFHGREIVELQEKLNKENLSDSLQYEYLRRLEILYHEIDIDSATVYAFEALKYAEKTDDYKQLIRSSLSIAQIYKEFREVYRALEYETTALKLAEANNDSSLLLASYRSIILTHIWYSEEYDIAKIYLKKGLKLAETMASPFNKSDIHFLFGVLYAKTGEYDLAEKFYNKALIYHREKGFKIAIANCLNNLGDVKEKKGELEEALEYNLQSLEINETSGDSSGIFINTFNIASIYSKMGEDQKFFEIINKELNHAQQQENLYRLKLIYELLYMYYEMQKDYENSLKYYKLMIEQADKESESSKSIQVRRIENKHMLEKVADQEKIYQLEIKNKTTSLYFITALLIFSVFLFITSIIYFVKTKKLEELKIKELKTKAELLALQYKINPHFLFNSLNSISQLIIKKSDSAEEMIQNLSDMLRYTLTFANKDFVTLGDELEAVRQYLEMEQIRFQERLEFQIECEETLKKYFIPPMVILPLVENSIKHGISKLIKNGKIFVKIFENDRFLNILVKDNGPESEDTIPVNSKHSFGFGHQSIIDRLKITYHENHNFEISNNDDVYCVKISIPINE